MEVLHLHNINLRCPQWIMITHAVKLGNLTQMLQQKYQVLGVFGALHPQVMFRFGYFQISFIGKSLSFLSPMVCICVCVMCSK